MILPPQQAQTSIRQNVTSLMSAAPQSQSRKKAIITIAKKNNISLQDAQFRQAVRIAQSISRRNGN